MADGAVHQERLARDKLADLVRALAGPAPCRVIVEGMVITLAEDADGMAIVREDQVVRNWSETSCDDPRPAAPVGPKRHDQVHADRKEEERDRTGNVGDVAPQDSVDERRIRARTPGGGTDGRRGLRADRAIVSPSPGEAQGSPAAGGSDDHGGRSPVARCGRAGARDDRVVLRPGLDSGHHV